MLLIITHPWTAWGPCLASPASLQPGCNKLPLDNHLVSPEALITLTDPCRGTCRHQWHVWWSCRRTTSWTALSEVVVCLEDRTLQLCSQAGVPPRCCNSTMQLWAQHCCPAVSQVLLGVCSAPKSSDFSEEWISITQQVESSWWSAVKSKEETSSISQFHIPLRASTDGAMEILLPTPQTAQGVSTLGTWGDTHWTANIWGEYLTERWRFSLCTPRLSQGPSKCRVMQVRWPCTGMGRWQAPNPKNLCPLRGCV